VLLVDADWQDQTLSRLLTTDTAPGLVQVLGGNTALTDAVWRDPVGNVTVLPVGAGAAATQDSTKLLAIGGTLASNKMRLLVEEFATHFDSVIICFPPLASQGDAMSADWVDAFIMVVEWKKTPRELIEERLELADTVRRKLAAVVLNKVSPLYLRRTSPKVRRSRRPRSASR